MGFKKEYRYERKIFIENYSRANIECYVKKHPLIFSEIFYQRNINNIYFDTSDFLCYRENIRGNSSRFKVRLRWYGNSFGIVKPILEVKSKLGYLGKKQKATCARFDFSKGISLNNIPLPFDSIRDSNLKNNVFVPALFNSYLRSYYLSSDKKYRITIDSDMKFYKADTFSNKFLNKTYDLTSTIIEIKYKSKDDKNIDSVTNYFPFRISKSSKYVKGISAIYGI